MYQPLNPSSREIRLLRVLPGREDDRIEVQLVVASLEGQSPIYEALSYVWGYTSVPADQITVNGVPKDVTRNLYRALRRVRSSDHPRVPWVDAICINQADIPERNHQVRMMRDIYSCATQVLAWLGEDTGDNASSLRNVTGERLQGEDDGSTVRNVEEAIELIASSPDVHWLDMRLGLAWILHLNFWLTAAWWSRVWTVQEAAVARSLVYLWGSTEIPGGTFKKVIRSFILHTSTRQCCKFDPVALGTHVELQLEVALGFQGFINLHRLDSLLESQDRGDSALSLSCIAGLCRGRDATDPRDKVYAFLGLCRAVQTGWVDYSLSVEETYQAAARQCIAFTKRLDVLFYCHPAEGAQTSDGSRRRRADAEDRPALRLPSWVPDWTLRHRRAVSAAISGRDSMSLGRWAAYGAHRDAVLDARDPPGRLGVIGHCFDSIAAIGEACVTEFLFLGLHGWRRLANVDRDPAAPYAGCRGQDEGGGSGSGTRLDAYWRTLCMGLSAADPEAASTANDAQNRMAHDYWWYTELCREKAVAVVPARADADVEGGGNARMAAAAADTFGQHVLECTVGRAFFVSDRGYFGLAPAGAAVRDRICLLAGGRVPYILRESESPESESSRRAAAAAAIAVRAFTLIGNSYVHGIMDGEGMADVEEGRAKLERWALM
ncbi:hypothetical protein RB595_010339 [Gaeumannomyces hyphopodioides]